jgi:glucokinase
VSVVSTPSSARRAIGVDVGGSKVAIGLVGADGNLTASARIDNREASDPQELLARTVEGCRQLLERSQGVVVEAIGIGLPELVDLDGEVRSASSIPWRREEILDAFGDAPPVVLEADVRAAALAEARFGAGRGHRSVAYVTVGTGVSSCLVLDGEPMAGSHGAAQLLGSTGIAGRCPACGSRNPLVLEEVGAGPGLVSTYCRRAGRAASGAEEVVAAAEAGDPVAVEVLEEAGEILGSFLALLIGVVDPEVLVLGGGVGSAAGPYWDATVRWTRRYIWADHVRDLPIHRAALGPAAGVIGAATVALGRSREGR